MTITGRAFADIVIRGGTVVDGPLAASGSISQLLGIAQQSAAVK